MARDVMRPSGGGFRLVSRMVHPESPGVSPQASRRESASTQQPADNPRSKMKYDTPTETVTIHTKLARTIRVHERMDGHALLWACAKASPFLPATFHGRGQPVSNHSLEGAILPDPARFNSLRERIGYWQSVLELDEPEDQLTAAVHAALSVYRHLMDDNPLSAEGRRFTSIVAEAAAEWAGSHKEEPHYQIR